MRRLAAALGLLPLAATAFEPLPLLDQAPLAGLTDLPPALPARKREVETLALLIGVSNTSHILRNDHEVLLIDGEQHHYRLSWTLPLQGLWELDVTLPVVAHGRGHLDHLVDQFHAATGLPEGDRPSYPQDGFFYYYRHDGDTALHQRTPTQGLGDLRLRLAQGLRQDAHTASRWAVALKLPSGDPDDLCGNGAWAVTLQGALERPALEHFWRAPLSLGLGAGLTWQGTAARLREQQRPLIGQLHLQLWWPITAASTLVAQLDGHTAPYQGSDLPLLGPSVQGSLGLQRRLGGGELSLAIVEDVWTETTADFTLHLGWRQPLTP